MAFRVFAGGAAMVLIFGSARAFEPNVSIYPGSKPQTVGGTTNLPDGTNLLVILTRKESGYVASDSPVVRSGHFETKDLNSPDFPMGPGRYLVEVITADGEQPDNLSHVFGKDGENLEGPHVKIFINKVFDETFYFIVPGEVDRHHDIEISRRQRDREVSGIGSECQSLYGTADSEAVDGCIEQAIKTIPR